MTSNNKAVKGCGGLPFLFTELPRRNVLGYSAYGIPSSRKLRGISRDIVLAALGSDFCTLGHRYPLTSYFESDKDCGMVCDAALRSAFMSLFAFVYGIERVRVRPDCYQTSHQNYSGEAWLQERQKPAVVLGLSVKSLRARLVRD